MQFYMSLVHLKTSEFIIFYFGNFYSQDAILFFHILEKNIPTLTKKIHISQMFLSHCIKT